MLTNVQLVPQHVRHPVLLVLAPLVFVSPVSLHNSPLLANVSLLARLELSVPLALVSSVTPIAPVAPDPLSSNVQHASRLVLFSHLDVAYQHVSNPNTST